MFYGGKSAVEALADEKGPKEVSQIPLVDETTPSFKDIYIKNINCTNAHRAMFFNGLPEMNIQNINLENISISATYGVELSESDGISMKNIKISSEKAPALLLNNIKNLKMSGFNYSASFSEIVHIKGKNTKNIQLPVELKKENVRNLE